MTKYWFAAIAAIAMTFAPAADTAPDWETLFDGRSFAGWQSITGRAVPASSWTIEDGCMRAKPNGRAIEDIRTAKTYRNFELEVEWRCPRTSNSGIKYLLFGITEDQTEEGTRARTRGFEYQLAGEEGERKAKAEPKYATGSLYGVIAPSDPHQRDEGEFNVSRIVVNGSRVEHWLNGGKLLEYSLASSAFAEAFQSNRKQAPLAKVAWESPIVLQNHNSEFWFRKVRIRPLR
ncbi:MAG: DUF1080 domain-containing protein [Bryobacteraceae bacterium]